MSFTATPKFLRITPFQQSVMRLETRRFLQHLYTRIPSIPIFDTGTGNPATDPGVNDWNLPLYQNVIPIINLPCFFSYRVRTIVQPYGVTNVDEAVLVVEASDTLAEGDHVMNILTLPDPVTGQSVSILLGPLIVEKVTPQDPLYGTSLFNEATLRDMRVVPNR